MGFGGKKKRRQEEVTVTSHTTPLWHVLCLLVIAGATISVAAMILNTWRGGCAIQYRYIFRSNEKRISVAETFYGLYTIVYDGGAAYITWPQRVQEIQTRGSVAIQMGQQSSSNASFQAWAAQCPPQCQDAISTRLSCYKRISTVSTILLGALSLAGALGLIGVSWFYIFGKLAYLQMGCWLLGGALCYGALGYWIWETDTCWRMIVAAQQYPYPAVGLPWYLALGSSGMYVFAGLGSIVADYVDTYNERKSKEEAQMRLMMEAGDAFDGFMTGPRPPGMPPPFIGAPGGGPDGMRPSMMGGPMPPGPPGMPGGRPMMMSSPMMMAGMPGMPRGPPVPGMPAPGGAPPGMMGMQQPPPGAYMGAAGAAAGRGMMLPGSPMMPPGGGFPGRPRPF